MQESASAVQIVNTIMDCLFRLVISGDEPPDPCTVIEPNSPTSDEVLQPHQPEPLQLIETPIDNATLLPDVIAQPVTPSAQQSQAAHQRFFSIFSQDTQAAKAANIDHFSPFDIEFCNILDDNQFENLLKSAHSGLLGAIWSAPPCKLYSQLRRDDGGPPPLRTKEYLDGLPSLTPQQLLQVQESKEFHRRSSILCIAVFQQGRFAAKEQPINSLAWCEFHQQFLSQCSCHFVATPACKWGLDRYKTWAIAATPDRIQSLAARCSHNTHQDIWGQRLPDGSFISALTAEYPSKLASTIIDIIRPWVSQSSSFNQDFTQWKSLLAKKPFVKGPEYQRRGNHSNWTIPRSQDIFKDVRKRWIARIRSNHFHAKICTSMSQTPT